FAHAQKPTPEQLQAALNDPYTIAFNQGFRAQTLEKLRDAEAAFDRAVPLARTDQQRVSALSFRGTLRSRLGWWQQARADLDAAIALDPDNLTTLFAMMEVARGQGDFRTAADALLALEKILSTL